MFDEAGINLHMAINVPVGVLTRLRSRELVRTHRPPSERWPGLILEVTRTRSCAHRARQTNRRRAARLRNHHLDRRLRRRLFLVLRACAGLPFARAQARSSFVKTAHRRHHAAICQTAIDLAHRFGSAAVAEGIEAAADMQSLIVMGCDFGQGRPDRSAMPQQRFSTCLRHRVGKPRPPAAEAAAAEEAPAGTIGRVA